MVTGERVSDLCTFYCQCLPASMMTAMRKILFWKMFYHNKPCATLFLQCCSSVTGTADIYNGTHHIVHLNNFALRNVVWSHFT